MLGPLIDAIEHGSVESSELCLTAFESELEATHEADIDVVHLDLMDDDSLRLVYTSPDPASDYIVGMYIALHEATDVWRARPPPGIRSPEWQPAGLTAIKHFERDGELHAQEFQVNPDWARQYLDDELAMSEVLDRVR